MSEKTRRQLIENTIDDLVSNFLYYDRKEDEDLPREEIEAQWRPVPPVDPFLLKHLGGTLYVVLAQWDLTPLEQAVLAGRLEQ